MQNYTYTLIWSKNKDEFSNLKKCIYIYIYAQGEIEIVPFHSEQLMTSMKVLKPTGIHDSAIMLSYMNYEIHMTAACMQKVSE